MIAWEVTRLVSLAMGVTIAAPVFVVGISVAVVGLEVVWKPTAIAN